MPIAFKEWAVTVRALAEGEQLLTLRKGGIREPEKHFKLDYERFFLYPTFDHQRTDLVRESHRPELVPRARGGRLERRRAAPPGAAPRRRAQPARPRADPRLGRGGRRTSPSPTAAPSTRCRRSTSGRPTTPRSGWPGSGAIPLHVILLRTYRIPRPVTVKVRDEYGGCRSWLELTRELPVRGHAGALRRGVRARLRGDRVDRLRSPARVSSRAAKPSRVDRRLGAACRPRRARRAAFPTRH